MRGVKIKRCRNSRRSILNKNRHRVGGFFCSEDAPCPHCAQKYEKAKREDRINLLTLGITTFLEFILLFLAVGLSPIKAISAASRNGNFRRKKICVIGAGAAGISATKHLSQNLSKFDITVYEKSSTIGGTWVYTENTQADEHGYPIHSSMYKNLRTNLPREIMNFPDFPEVKGYNKSCVPHYVIQKYLESYTRHFRLKRFIKFNTMVLNVELKERETCDQWIVTVRDLKSDTTKSILFDGVIVCNGHYFKPNIPIIPGIENFTGEIMHSHCYRRPEEFKGRIVIVLGAGSSGIDISQELLNYSPKVYLSHNHDRLPESYGFTQVPGIDRFEKKKFVLKDGSKIYGDVLLLCTGYLYSYPFLDKSTGIVLDKNHISPLYKHIVNVHHPTMNFVGVPMGITPFPLFYAQSQFIRAMFEGKVELPSVTEMLKDSKPKVKNKKYAHLVDTWDYPDELAAMGGFDTIPELYKKGHRIWMAHRAKHSNFKDFNFVVDGDKISVKYGGQESESDGTHDTLLKKVKRMLWYIRTFGVHQLN